MKPHILVEMPIPPVLRSMLESKYDVAGPLDQSLVDPASIVQVRALITLGGLRTDAVLMDKMPKLGLVHCYGTGFEGVDRLEAAKRSIIVTNAGDTNSTSVAEFTIGLMIASARNIVLGDDAVRAGKWLTHPIRDFPLMAPGLAGRRVGIYGMGTIGLKIARRAAALEMQVGYFNRSKRSDVDYTYFDDLRRLAEWCDILVVSVRASADTRHTINGAILNALGSEGTIVNISRGSVVDEIALCEALESGQILSAALDVFEHEPNVPERLRMLHNVVLTPHIAAFSKAAQLAQVDMMLSNLDAFFNNGKLRSVVPPPH